MTAARNPMLRPAINSLDMNPFAANVLYPSIVDTANSMSNHSDRESDDIEYVFTRPEYPNQEELDELQALMKRVGEENAHIENVITSAALDMEFYEDMREIYQQMAAVVAVDPEFRPYSSLDGEFMIGTDLDERPVGLTRRQLNEHVLVVGRTGVGKTTFFYNLMDTCQEKQLPFMVFDFKNDYRHVAEEFDMIVVSWQDLKFNPLQPPPGVRLERWAEVLADTWTHAMGLWKASRGYFLRKLRQLYRLYNSDIEEGVYPSLFELRDLARADQISHASPRYRYKERLDNRVTGMLGFSGRIFDCSRGYPIEEFLDRNVVFELQEPHQDVQTFIVEALLTWIFYYRDAMTHRQGLRHVIMFDEAKQVFDINREKDTNSPNPPITNLMGKVREFGEALVVADHEPSKLSDSLKANTNAKLWMSLGSGKDTDDMRETFGLDDDRTEFTRTLKRGEGVLWVADDNPVPVLLPDYRVEKTTTEEDIRTEMEAVLEPFSWQERVRPRYFKEVVGERVDDDTEDANEKKMDVLSERLLASVNDAPFLSISERYEKIGVTARQGNKAKTELVDRRLVREVPVRTGKPGRNPKFLELTDEGRSVLEAHGFDVEAVGRRGVEHRYWQKQIKEFYEDLGCDVEIEFSIGKQAIDVYAVGDGEVVAVEVARSPEHELTNIMKSMEFGVDRIEVAYFEDRVKEKIETVVRDQFGEVPEQVRFVPVNEFV